jgi:EAL domain-containing protein (putative c-di-GMP-specific phosphodiesterase class I)
LSQARHVSGGLRRAISETRFQWEGKVFTVGVSIGVVPINADSESITSVLSAADTACYAAKDRGRNRIHVYHQGDRELNQRQGEMQWVARINDALEEDRFRLYYQPIARINDGAGEGMHYEVLVRLRRKEGEQALARSFLGAAERYNLAVKIDRWVLGYVMEWLMKRPDHVERLDLCTINISGQSVADEDFLGFAVERFKDTGLSPAKICFEITETAAIANFTRATSFINALRALGCRFSLDDFGSGLSSFAYLKTLPVDYLKIDGIFVKGVVDDPIDLAMVKSINDLGRVMGKKTIAEFVENEAILRKVKELGVDYAQGHFLGEPRPIEELA